MYDSISLLMILVPALPLIAAILVATLGPNVLRDHSHWPIVVAIWSSFFCSLGLLHHVWNQPSGYQRVESVWSWANVEDAQARAVAEPNDGTRQVVQKRPFQIDVTLRIDALTCIMLTMVTLISSLVAVFSIGYMHADRGYWRFFAYIGLFVFSMTMLVSVSNFLLLFVFWEAVGVCSYLLIGFWYEKPSAAAAGKKAFLVNRVGDFGFMLGLFLIWTTYGTLNYHDTPISQDGPPAVTVGHLGSVAVPGVLGATRIESNDYQGGRIGLAICLLLLLGACGKSAQFPLHVWLPDAMEGPSPVSALIHAATMVTAGVYMIARCTPLFSASSDGQLLVASVGGFTALFAGLIALTQFDLKRVLAYSTISQLGYMFLALGTGTLAGISAGMFHLFTHAFFKSLLFLGAGSVMHAMGNVIDMRQFGGLRKRMPYTFWTFLIGCVALSGIAPFSGFWSKDAIVASVHSKAHHLEMEWENRQDGAENANSPTGKTGDEQIHPTSALSVASHTMSDAQLARAASGYQWLYYMAMFTGLLTAFYTFRVVYLTFFGAEMIPPEAGDHAHESPPIMVWPLVALAVFAAAVGLVLDQSWLNGTNPFAEFLGKTPSLTGSVAATETLGAFHFTVAAVSMLLALAGVLLATYLYLGDRREVRALKSLMDFHSLTRMSDAEVLTRLGRRYWVQVINQAASRVGFGWLIRLIGQVVMLCMLVISAPLLLGRFVSPYRLSYGKFFVDQIYSALIVRPLRGLAAVCNVVDQWVVDGTVNLIGRLPWMFGNLMRSMQTGLIQFYALAMVLGGLVLLLAVDQQLSGPISQFLNQLFSASASGVGP